MSLSKNLYVDQGSSFVEIINVDDPQGYPLNLNNYTPVSQIKKTYSSTESIYFDITITTNTQLRLYLDAYATANLTSNKYVYDVILSDEDGNVQRIQEGTIIVSPGVSRWP